MTTVRDDHAESAFWDANDPRSADERPCWTSTAEELPLRPEVVSLQRWLDLNA